MVTRERWCIPDIYTELNKNNAKFTNLRSRKNTYDIEYFNVKKSLKTPKNKTKAVNRRKRYNSFLKKERTRRAYL